MQNVYKESPIVRKKTMARKEVVQTEESVEEVSEETSFDEGIFEGLDASSDE